MAPWQMTDLRCLPKPPLPLSYPSAAELKRVAQDRVAVKAGYRDRKRPGGRAWDDDKGQGEVQRRLIGLLGEREVAILLGLPMRVDVSRKGDKRANLVTGNGVPVDVITRTIPSTLHTQAPDLLLNVAEPPRPELALVLVAHLGMTCQPIILGWVWEDLVRQRNHRVRYSANESFSYSAADLFPISRLKSSQPWEPRPVQIDMFGGSP